MSRLQELDAPDEWVPGVVTFDEWMRVPWVSRVVQGVIGMVRVVSADQATGFKIEGGGHANWLALVRGPSGVTHVIPGCKVSSITYDEFIEAARRQVDRFEGRT